METTNLLNKKQLTTEECIVRLETLIKSYQKDSEFNYQLNVSDSPFNQLKDRVLWKPIEEYSRDKYDWVLVKFVEKRTGFIGLPHIAEMRIDNKWHLDSEDANLEYYFNNDCIAVVFKEI